MSDHDPYPTSRRLPEDDDPSPEVDYKEYRARLDKRDQLLANPDLQRRHQTVMLVKKTELSPGELAALGGRRRWKWALALALVGLIFAGGVALVYSPWLSPPPLTPPPRPADPPLIPPSERQPAPVSQPSPAPKPAFEPVQIDFIGKQAVNDLRQVLRQTEGWSLTPEGLVAPPHTNGLVSWLKLDIQGNLALEVDVSVAALPDRAPEQAREFQIVFGDGVSDLSGIHFRAPSLAGDNRADSYDDVGRRVGSAGQNHYGWPFETGKKYRLKVVRIQDRWTFSRDGEVICNLHYDPAGATRIGLLPVSGATLRYIRVEAR